MSTAASMTPIHPGEILAEEYLAPLGITQHGLVACGTRIDKKLSMLRRLRWW